MKLVVNRTDVVESEMQSVEWAGNTNNVIFVKDNDIYLKYEHSNEEVRFTFNGRPGLFYNGVPDWLYQGKSESLVDAFTNIWRGRDNEWVVSKPVKLTECYELGTWRENCYLWFPYVTPLSMVKANENFIVLLLQVCNTNGIALLYALYFPIIQKRFFWILKVRFGRPLMAACCYTRASMILPWRFLSFLGSRKASISVINLKCRTLEACIIQW